MSTCSTGNCCVPQIDVVSGSSNSYALGVYECGILVNLAYVDRFVIAISDTVSVDSNEYPQCFDWSGRTEPNGVLVLTVGLSDIDIKNQIKNSQLFLYDDVYYTGIYCGDIRLRGL